MLTTARKATFAAIVAILTNLASILKATQTMTWNDLVQIVVFGLVAFVTVYQTTNTTPTG